MSDGEKKRTKADLRDDAYEYTSISELNWGRDYTKGSETTACVMIELAAVHAASSAESFHLSDPSLPDPLIKPMNSTLDVIVLD